METLIKKYKWDPIIFEAFPIIGMPGFILKEAGFFGFVTILYRDFDKIWRKTWVRNYQILRNRNWGHYSRGIL